MSLLVVLVLVTTNFKQEVVDTQRITDDDGSNHLQIKDLDVSKNSGKTPKMDGENFMKNPMNMDDLGWNPLFLG